jgi:hypothetical protein
LGFLGTTRTFKFVIEHRSDGYLAYPLGLKGVVMGQGESFEAALHDAKSVVHSHIVAFGAEAFDDNNDVDAAFVAEGVIVTRTRGREG